MAGGGETGALIHGFDWSTTSLGPSERWSGALKALTRAVLHARQPMLLWWGPDLIQIYNDAFRPSLGAGKHPHAIGQPARECWSEVWPLVGAQLEDVVAKGQPSWFEEVLVPILRNGKLEDAWWTYNYSPAFDDDGSIAGILIICTEITAGIQARRELERANAKTEAARQELQAAFMQVPLPIAILAGEEHRFTLANRAYDEFVQRPVLGRTLREAFNDAEVDDYRPMIERVRRTGEPVLVREAPLQLSDAQGGLRNLYIDAAYYPYRDADLVVRGVVAVINDVTRSVAARIELETVERERAGNLEREQSLRAAAEAGQRARDEFLAMLGHELRNPLAPIAAATELLRLPGGDHDKLRAIIERQVSHLSRLVDDLLDVSRVAGGKIELRREIVDLASVITRSVEMVQPLLDVRSHAMSVELPDYELLVDGDPTRLAQVFANLLNNAAKYTPTGGVIALRAERVGQRVEVHVSDNGPGIAADLLPRVFDLFVQGAQSIERREGGLGLGLALVKNLVTLHGGTVSVRNGSKAGSVFSVSLPLRSVAQHQGRALNTDRMPSAPITKCADARKILIVDDNEDAAELLAEFLRRSGHQVLTAYDAPTALEALASFAADTALLDLGLPGMDGYELARRIRAQIPDVWLVAVTGYGQEHDRANTLLAGFDLHLTKPIELRHLSDLISSDDARSR